MSFEYVPLVDQIVLSIGKNAAMSVDCTGFAKDGRVSAVALNGHELVLSFSESKVEALSALSSLSVSLDGLVVKDYVHVAGEENVGPLGLSGDLSVSGTLYVKDGGELSSLEEFVGKRTGGVKEAIRNSLGLLAEDPLATLNPDSRFEDVVSALVDIRDTLLALSAALSA